MRDSLIRERLIRNFYKGSGQYQETSRERVWAKATPEDIYNLLKACSGAALPMSKSVLLTLASRRWTIAATAHEGGQDARAPLHFTVRAKGQTAYHFNCKEMPGRGLHIVKITQDRNV